MSSSPTSSGASPSPSETSVTHEVTSFDDFANQPDDRLDLEVGALLLAQDAYPSLDIAQERARLNLLATSLPESDLSSLTAEQVAEALSRHLHERNKFRGNEEDYGDPRNSYLNVVLNRHVGIPLTLSLVWLGVLKRHNVRASGISFPGHFLVRIERTGPGPLIIDPFNGGQSLTMGSLQALLRRSAGGLAKLRIAHLAPASPRSVLVRLLHNLKTAHAVRGDFARAYLAATRIVTLRPNDPDALRDRGLLAARLGVFEAAREDLERYLVWAPDATDVSQIRALLTQPKKSEWN